MYFGCTTFNCHGVFYTNEIKLIIMESVRWAMNFGSWKPTRAEWIRAMRCVQVEEKERISRFVYAKDAKASLVGRLLMRKLFVEKLRINNDVLKLGRNDKEKPFVINEINSDLAPALSFNVSHHGSYTVLAAEKDRPIGVDVMKIVYSGGKSVSEFFKTMNRQFTDAEWQRILAGADDAENLTNFYRNWCLKESYVKAIGIGIGFNLKRLSFAIQKDKLEEGKTREDTQLKVDGSLASNWSFQETMLDEEHCVAVALGPRTNQNEDLNGVHPFVTLTFEDLVQQLTPLNPEDIENWEQFQLKPE